MLLFASFIGWTMGIFAALVLVFWYYHGMPLILTCVASLACAVFLGTLFAFVMSPTAFVRSVVYAHPKFFASAPWSVLTVGVFWVGLSLTGMTFWLKVRKGRESRGSFLGEREVAWDGKY
jgi:hypothetical protein